MQQADRSRLQQALVRLAEGDRSAFDDVFELLWPVYRRFTQRVLAGAPDADDVGQEALMKLFAHVSRFDRSRDALAWSLAIVANECRAARRRVARRREDALSDGDSHGASPSPEEALLHDELEQLLGRAIESLGPLDRETIALALDQGAHRAGCDATTWRKRWQRARTRLRAAWMQHDES
jgi:RNA polymerase sigma-70 factor (ECF subfamily)